MNKSRTYCGYFLNEWDPDVDSPCDKCELAEECDRLADDFGLDYFMCLSKGVVKDDTYKKNHPKAFFKKID